MDFKSKKIDLFGTTWTIEYVDSITDDENDHQIFGCTNSAKRMIYIAKTIDGIKISEGEIKLTLFHELVHAILMTGQYMEESDNEALVEWLARCINQISKKNIL